MQPATLHFSTVALTASEPLAVDHEDLSVDANRHVLLVAQEELRVERVNNDIFRDRVRLCILTVSLLISIACFVPMTLLWVQIIGNPYWIQMFADSSYRISFWTSGLVGAPFIAEIALRLSQWRFNNFDPRMFYQITFHHVGFFVLQLIFFAAAEVTISKMSLTILVAWTYEWSLFAPFWIVRLYDSAFDASWNKENRSKLTACPSYRRFVHVALPCFVVVYFVTRTMEAIVLLMLVACGCQRGVSVGDQAPGFWVVSVLVFLLVGLQFHAGWLLVSLYQRRVQQLKQTTPQIPRAEPSDKPQQQQDEESTEEGASSSEDVPGSKSLQQQSLEDQVSQESIDSTQQQKHRNWNSS